MRIVKGNQGIELGSAEGTLGVVLARGRVGMDLKRVSRRGE